MRKVHFVGSLPGESTEDALNLVEKYAGQSIGPCLSDGETGERSGWMIHIYEAQRQLPELEIAKEGDFSSWENTPRLRVKAGAQFKKADLRMMSQDCRDSLQEFEKFKSKIKRPDLDFMIGVISPLGLSYQIFGSATDQWKQHVEAFQRGTVMEINEINKITKGNVVFQIEIPIEMIMLVKQPSDVWEETANELAKQMLQLVNECDPGIKFGIHLCWGDLAWGSSVIPDTAEPLVIMTNAISKIWPSGRELVYFHVPFVIGLQQLSLSREYYQPIQSLNLVPETQFFAGFIDERMSVNELIQVRNYIESFIGNEVGISSTCGLGRRPLDEAIKHIELSVQVANTP